MPLFSNRSIASVFAQLAGKLPQERRNDLLSRLTHGADGAIAAEWELTVFACLARRGDIEFLPKQEGVADIDVIYTSRATRERAMVEITAISDRGLHERNPVNLFSDMLWEKARKLRKTVNGGFSYQIGYVKVNGEIVLGVPDRKNMAEFFASDDFRRFVANIRKNPSVPQAFRFNCRGADSAITYKPGVTGGGGGHIAHDVILRMEKNHIRSRLESKDEQLKRAGLRLPAIVVMCDAGCSALRGMVSPGQPSWQEVIDGYLNGRSFPMPGPPMPPQTIRMNAVVVAIARENYDFSTGQYHRRIDVKYAAKRAETAFPLNEGAIDEVARAILDGTPTLRTMPINASRNYNRPCHYGGFEITSRKGRPAVKISLLTLQGLLAGEISYSDFVGAHQPVVTQIKSCVDEGRMISSIQIDKSEDQDDDWVWLEFGSINPKHVFEKLKGDNR